MDIDKIEKTIAVKYEEIENLKKMRESIKESCSEDIKIIIQTKRWYGFIEPFMCKEKLKLNRNKDTALALLNAAIDNERKQMDKLIDMEIEARGRSDTKQ